MSARSAHDKARRRRRISWIEVGFWLSQTPLIFILAEPLLIKYLAFLSIYACARTAASGAQADTPD